GMIAYKYPEKKKVKPKKRREMQNIDITLDDNTVTLSIDTEKDFGPSSTGKSIIVASSRGNRLIEGTDVYVGINIFKKRKTSPKKKIDQIKAKPAITKPKKTKPITEEPVKSPEPKPSITESKKDKAKPIAEEPAKSPEPKPSITGSKKKKDKSSTEKLAESPESESLIKNGKSPKFKLEDIRGLGPSKIKLLNSCGIYTIEDLINCDPNIVANKVRGLGIKSLKKWIQSAKELSLE
ncbi:MAG: helix-hairpin-helix domain-containing protein, partial [Candidatus Helarchaeota archaeon]